MTRTDTARIVILTGFAIGLRSHWATFSHIADPNYLLALKHCTGGPPSMSKTESSQTRISSKGPGESGTLHARAHRG